MVNKSESYDYSQMWNSNRCKNPLSMRVSNRLAELFRCDEIHLKLLTDRSFQDTSHQLNTLAFRVWGYPKHWDSAAFIQMSVTLTLDLVTLAAIWTTMTSTRNFPSVASIEATSCSTSVNQRAKDQQEKNHIKDLKLSGRQRRGRCWLKSELLF